MKPPPGRLWPRQKMYAVTTSAIGSTRRAAMRSSIGSRP